MRSILQNKPGKMILLGNESIVRGALESGVQFVSTYPGTPASEIGNIFFKLSQGKDFRGHFEFSVNEKVALEAGIGASFSGLKTLVAMKSFGLNVCLDSLFPFVYIGAKGPTVIIVADDPSCHSSAQSEENSRFAAQAIHIPVLEPADPQECKDFVKLGFQISKKFKIPVIIRTTTRVAHQRALVSLAVFDTTKLVRGEFIKKPKRFVTMPPRVLEMKGELLGKIKKIQEFSEKSKINKIEGNKKLKIGIIASGISYLYVREALKELNLDLPVFKLGFFYPLPEKKISNFLKNLKKVLMVEELEPYLEKEIERLAKDVNCKLKVIGKELLPEVGELKPEQVTLAIAKAANFKCRSLEKLNETRFTEPCSPDTHRFARADEGKALGELQAPKRLPRLCPGCPYWFVVSAIKKAVDVNEVVFGGEIGCYMIFGNSPVNLQDYLSCMGSSVGIGHGIKKATGQKLIAFVGDSSFFHAGIPALINTVNNRSNPLVIILDNQTTAMTGHQPHPGAPTIPNGIKMENIVQACGVKNLKVLDPINQEELIKTIKEFLEKPDVSVIISRRPCKFAVKK